MSSVSFRPNGWIRLWMFLSVVWIGIVTVIGIFEVKEITEDTAKHVADHRPAFFDQLSPAHRGLLVLNEQTPAGEETLPSAWTKFRLGVTKEQAAEVWHAYVDIADHAWREERRSQVIRERVAWALIPSLLGGVLALGVAWVIGGFRKSNKQV